MTQSGRVVVGLAVMYLQMCSNLMMLAEQLAHALRCF